MTIEEQLRKAISRARITANFSSQPSINLVLRNQAMIMESQLVLIQMLTNLSDSPRSRHYHHAHPDAEP